MSTKELFKQALQLPETHRASLAHQLLASLEAEGVDEDWETAWTQEIDARLAETADGNFAASDWRDSIARIRQKIELSREDARAGRVLSQEEVEKRMAKWLDA